MIFSESSSSSMLTNKIFRRLKLFKLNAYFSSFTDKSAMWLKKVLRTNVCLSWARSFKCLTTFDKEPVLSFVIKSKHFSTLWTFFSCFALEKSFFSALSMWICSRMFLKSYIPICVNANLNKRNLLLLRSHTSSRIFGRAILFFGYWSIKFVTKDLQNLFRVLNYFWSACENYSNINFSWLNSIDLIWDSESSLWPATSFFPLMYFINISKGFWSSIPES